MDNNSLEHHGIKGQKWGVRRFQDYNGKRIGAGGEQKRKRQSYYDSVTSETIKQINPHYGEEGYTTNCASCAMALDLMSRGYNVTAARFDGLFAYEDIPQYYKNPGVMRTPGALDRLDSILKRAGGEGSNGIICMDYDGLGTGHIFNWEVHNGNVYYTDGQCPVRFRGQERLYNYFYPFDNNYGAYVVRLDKAEPNIEMMKQHGLVDFLDDKEE